MPNTEVMYIKVWASVDHITNEAVLITSDEDGEKYWVPKSCLAQRTLDELSVGNVAWEMRIAEWLVEKEGIA